MKPSALLKLLRPQKKPTPANNLETATNNSAKVMGKRILIIEDSPSQTQMLKQLLTKYGFETSTAGDGKEGLEKVKLIKPDLVLLDIVMPDMNGFQVARQITQNPKNAHIPVIVVSTKSMATDKLWAKRQGASDYVTKPVNEEELLSKIRQHLLAVSS